jgi:predicted nucleotidyltransferase
MTNLGTALIELTRGSELGRRCFAETSILQANEATFSDVVRAIRSVAEPSAIVLFGSYARGNANDQSDIDLLVIRSRDFSQGESRRKELGRLYRAVAARVSIPKDILLLTKREFEDWRTTTNHPASEAFREGRVLYGEV